MPTDNRRFQGPENSQPYQVLGNSEGLQKENTSGKKPKKQSEIRSPKKTKLLNKAQKRKDGRTKNDLRQMFMKTGVVSQAKGSAYIEVGNTKVICSVFDPREIPRRSEYSITGELFCEFKFAPFSCQKRRSYVPDNEEKEYGLLLKQALESAVCRHEFPNFQVDIFATVLQNDGSALPAAITCAGLAIADACLPMYDVVVGASLSIHGNDTLLDPTIEEEYHSSKYMDTNAGQDHGNIMLSYMPSIQQVSSFVQDGNMNASTVISGLQMLKDACSKVYILSQHSLVKTVKKAIKKNPLENSEDTSES